MERHVVTSERDDSAEQRVCNWAGELGPLFNIKVGNKIILGTV
jgi:hypothetical protein